MPVDEEARLLKWRAQQMRLLVEWTDKPAYKQWLVERADELLAEAARLQSLPTLPAAAAIASGEPPIGSEAAAALKIEPAAEPEPASDATSVDEDRVEGEGG
jgi:hypothetical protein